MGQQRRHIEPRLGGAPQGRRRVEPAQPLHQRLCRRAIGKIGLGEHQAVGHGHLLGAFGLTRQLRRPVHRIDRGDDVAQPEMVFQDRIGLHRGEDGKRIGKTGTLDHQPAEVRDLAAGALGLQVLDRIAQLAADGAAQASGLQQHHGIVDALQQVMVQSHLAELVDQHRRIGQRRMGEQALQQGRLARAQKAGDEIDRRLPDHVTQGLPPAGSGRPDPADRRACPAASRPRPRGGSDCRRARSCRSPSTPRTTNSASR